MRNSPCARLMTRIIPKMTASPRLIRMKIENEKPIWKR